MDERDRKFDESVRRILSEPEEKLPEGLWDGIEARLDAMSAASRRRAAFRRVAAAVLSTAAAAALGFVIFDVVRPDSSVGTDGVVAEAVVRDADAVSAREAEAVSAREAAADGAADGVAVEDGSVQGAVAGNVSSEETVAAQKAVAANGSAAKSADASPTKSAGRIEVVPNDGGGLLADAGNVTEAKSDISTSSADNSRTDDAMQASDGRNTENTAAEGSGTGNTAGRDAGNSSDKDPENSSGRDTAAGNPGTGTLTVDNSDIESVYGKEKSGRRDRRVPFSLTLGANSGAGPKKEAGPVMMFSRGDRTPSGTTLTEEAYPDSYDLPLSFGLGVKFRITKWLAVGTGLTYSLLGKKVTGTYQEVDDEGNTVTKITTSLHNSQHYLGIPLDLYFSAFRNKRWDVYGSIGGGVEKCLGNRYRGSSEGRTFTFNKQVKGVQTSVKAGLGVEYSPVSFLGIYVDPGVRYYFDCSQPKSIRTEQPLEFVIEAGLRFNL